MTVKAISGWKNGKWSYEVHVAPQLRAASGPEYDTKEEAIKAGKEEEKELRRRA